MSITKSMLLQHQVTTDNEYIEIYKEFARLTGKAYPLPRDGVFIATGKPVDQYNRNILLDYELYVSEFNQALLADVIPLSESWSTAYELKAMLLGRVVLSRYKWIVNPQLSEARA